MGDRRVADRRAPEDGVIKIETQKLVLYIIFTTIFIISIISNIIFVILYNNYKNAYEAIYNDNNYYAYDDDEYIDDSSEAVSEVPCVVTAIADKSQVGVGETITYDFKVQNINSGNSIVMCSAVLEYATDLFDCKVVTEENGEWVKNASIEDYLNFNRKDMQPSSEDQTIAKIQLTVKEAPTEVKTLDITHITFTTNDDKIFTVPSESVIIPVE